MFKTQNTCGFSFSSTRSRKSARKKWLMLANDKQQSQFADIFSACAIFTVLTFISLLSFVWKRLRFNQTIKLYRFLIELIKLIETKSERPHRLHLIIIICLFNCADGAPCLFNCAVNQTPTRNKSLEGSLVTLRLLNPLTCDLHPDAEVDVRVTQISLHQDVVPLLPGRYKRE